MPVRDEQAGVADPPNETAYCLGAFRRGPQRNGPSKSRLRIARESGMKGSGTDLHRWPPRTRWPARAVKYLVGRADPLSGGCIWLDETPPAFNSPCAKRLPPFQPPRQGVSRWRRQGRATGVSAVNHGNAITRVGAVDIWPGPRQGYVRFLST